MGEITYRLDHFRLAGICITITSILTIFTALASFVHLQMAIDGLQEEIVFRQMAFKAKSQVIWGELIETGRRSRVPRQAVEELLKKGTLHQCSQCTRLHCPQGGIGLEGAPGSDGQPGLPGKPGAPGFDGTDVELDPQDELPCSICPAGPQGPRGAQGERGLPGQHGRSGPSGVSGRPGQAGGHGAPGARGAAGTPGANGIKGPPGETIVAGEGVKGPPGLAGPQGPKGPPGTNGRSSNIRGAPGRVGGHGPIGATGKFGSYGEVGGVGAPGEPGLPATYCPSDCGVNTILSQIGVNAQHADSINGETAPPSAYPEEENVDLPEPFPTPSNTVKPKQEHEQQVDAADESFEETSYRNFFFSQ